MTPRDVVHIGLPKTATTALQHHVLPHLDGIRYGPSHGPDRIEAMHVLLRDLRTSGDTAHLANAFAGLVADLRGSNGVPVVLSDEGLSWAPDRIDPAEFHHRTATRLHRTLPDANVLVTIREQTSMLRSFYAEEVAIGLGMGFGDYLNGVGSRLPSQRVARLHYDTLVAAYHEVFGPDQVTVLAFEQLQEDPATFLGRVGELLGTSLTELPEVDVRNRALSAPSRTLLRTANRAFGRSDLYARARPRLRRLLQLRVDPRLFADASRSLPADDEAILAALRPTYADGNARVEHLTGLDLGALGYARTSIPASDNTERA